MFAELCITSNFTFLTGASHPEEFMQRAASLGLTAIAIADQDTVAGIVRAHATAREIARQVAERQAHLATHDIIGPPDPARAPEDQGPRFTCPRLIPAATLHLAEGLVLTALPENRTGWAHLCRLLTLGRRRAPKGGCDLRLTDLEGQTEGLHFLLHPPRPDSGARDWLPLASALTRRLVCQMHLVMAPRYDGQDRARFDRLAKLAVDLGIPTLASATPLMHEGRRRQMADVLTAIRTGTTVDRLGRAALANGEQRLRSEAEMRRLFGPHAAAVDRAGALADRLTFSLDALRYEYPSEVTGGETAAARLRRLALAGLD